MTETTPSTDDPCIAVTGAAGFIGSRVIKRLREEHPEWDVLALDNFYRGQLRQIADVTVQHVDIRNRCRLEEALEGADVVVHLAAVSGVDDCKENADLAQAVNVGGTNAVAWFCRKTGAGMVFPSSMAVLGDPEQFPITADHPRQPMNWYGRTKMMGESAVDAMAEGAFPAHLFLISNLYGEHVVDGRRVSKGTVINFFVSRAFADESLTVYEPGTQARNYVHVKDVANAYVRSTERLLGQLAAGETGSWKYEIASDEDPSIRAVAELVRDLTAEETGREPPIELVENPRSNETLVSEFSVDTAKAEAELNWEAKCGIEDSVRTLLAERLGSTD
jgi:UDP-glucose 4-epimerase